MSFQSTYVSETTIITQKFRGNLDYVMSSLYMMDEYKSKLVLLESKNFINRGRLAEKEKELSKVIALEDIDTVLWDELRGADSVIHALMLYEEFWNKVCFWTIDHIEIR